MSGRLTPEEIQNLPEDLRNLYGGPDMPYDEPPNIAEVPMSAFEERWPCGAEGCKGEMNYVVYRSWATTTSGHEHRCNKCRQIKYARHAYPRIIHRPTEQ